MRLGVLSSPDLKLVAWRQEETDPATDEKIGDGLEKEVQKSKISEGT